MFFFSAQKVEKSPPILHSSPNPSGIIEPQSTVDIPLALEVQERGPQEAIAYIAVFGSEEPPMVSGMNGRRKLPCLGSELCAPRIDNNKVECLRTLGK